MKALAIILISCLALACAIPANFNQALSINSTATSYTFLTVSTPIFTSYALELVASSSSASASSSATVGIYNSLPISFPSGAVAANGGLPAGYVSFGLPTGLGAGLSINFTSDIEGNVDARVSLPPSAVSLNVSVFGSFRPLYYNATARAYYELPTNQFNISASGGVTIFTRVSINIVFAVVSPLPLAISITNGAVIYANLVANRAANFAITEGTGTALYIYNLTAAAGTVAISSISATSSRQYTAVSSNNVLVSGIYSFNHSAGSRVNAQLSYDVSRSSRSFNASVTANARWYVFDEDDNEWDYEGGSVSGSVVVYSTDHFSDWSVQSNPQGGAGSTLEIPMFVRLLKFLF